MAVIMYLYNDRTFYEVFVYYKLTVRSRERNLRLTKKYNRQTSKFFGTAKKAL